MNEKELWLEIMDFIHDEEHNCNNFAHLLEFTMKSEEHKEFAPLIIRYLTVRSNMGKTIKQLIDDFILQGERKEK